MEAAAQEGGLAAALSAAKADRAAAEAGHAPGLTSPALFHMRSSEGEGGGGGGVSVTQQTPGLLPATAEEQVPVPPLEQVPEPLLEQVPERFSIISENLYDFHHCDVLEDQQMIHLYLLEK